MRIRFGFALALVCCFAVALIAQEPKKSMHATGRVTTVAADSIAVNTGAASLTFGVDTSTKVVGKGVGTKSGELKAQGKSPALTDLVEQYDNVSVEYRDSGDGKLHATRIDIRSKGTKTP